MYTISVNEMKEVTVYYFQSTVTVDRSVLELKELMTDLPDYADQFLNMICNVLRGYRDTCHSAYRGRLQALDFLFLLINFGIVMYY